MLPTNDCGNSTDKGSLEIFLYIAVLPIYFSLGWFSNPPPDLPTIFLNLAEAADLPFIIASVFVVSNRLMFVTPVPLVEPGPPIY